MGQSVYFKNANVNSFNADAHIIDLYTKLPNNFTYYDPRIPTSVISSNYEEYNSQLQHAALGDRNSITPESENIQGNDPLWWGSLVYQVSIARKNRDLYSNAQFIMQPQIHSNAFKTNQQEEFQFGNREPTNEEIQTQAMISIAHGAEGICWFLYPSVKSVYNSGTLRNYYQGNNSMESADTMFVYNYGLTELLQDDPTLPPRYSNMYGQDKWNYVKKMNIKIEHWKPTLDLIKWDSGFSVHSEGAAHNFISDIKSIKRNPSLEYSDAPPCTYCDQTNERFWEMGFFKPDFENPDVSANDKSKYFMMVNRRCVPDEDNLGDFRQLRIKFDSTELSGFTNWKIIELDTNNVITTFNKNTASYINMGEFKPGEGKLYKLAPVMQEGGTLVTNEDCSGTFDCRGEVNNNGYDINISHGTTINFADSSAGIIMTEGDFKSGITSSGDIPVHLKGKDGNLWKGIKLQNCPSVEIERTYFENISPYGPERTYAVDIINCGYVNISSCSFLSDENINAGGVRANFTTDDGLDIEAYILNNYFKMDAGNISALSLMTSGYLTFPVIIQGNNFESYTGNSNNAMLISGIEGGAIKSNTITGYKNGIILIWSAMDFYGNIITGGDEDSKGILSYASSYANLGETGIAFTGGYNSISCEGENSKCIDVDNSFLYLDKGINIFDLISYDPGNAFHLSGNISDEAYADPVDATNNCFRVSQTDTDAVHNMIWTSMQEPINFNFLDYNCDGNPLEGMIAFDLGNGMYDTIYTESGGSGGGKSNYELRIRNYELRANIELITVKSLEDSVSLNLRKRDYARVSDLCYELLTDHIDSLKDISILSKLYLAELRLDSSGNRITNLKSFLETLILNNPDKESFVKQSFYVIQKCKVSLEMYESAMSGFQEIMNQNPYSYEGLLASWDYEATSLLLNGQGGSGGGISNYKLQITNKEPNYESKKLGLGMSDLEFEEPDLGIDNDFGNNKSQIQNPKFQIFEDDPQDKYDSKQFTKEDRKVIRENVFKSFETSRDKEIEKVKSLEKKVIEGNANKNEKSELKVKKVLSEVIKVKKPKDITEHINTVNGNIQKVFGSKNEKHTREVTNIIPTMYNLSQNYPNPFNPVTKINFDLPNAGNVKLIVYDLLGKEVARLINNEFRASGRYTVEFNGINLASGVYFYRLETNKFVQTKRMVLIK